MKSTQASHLTLRIVQARRGGVDPALRPRTGRAWHYPEVLHRLWSAPASRDGRLRHLLRAAGRLVDVYGDGEQARDMTYVFDAVAATVAAVRRADRCLQRRRRYQGDRQRVARGRKRGDRFARQAQGTGPPPKATRARRGPTPAKPRASRLRPRVPDWKRGSRPGRMVEREPR